MKNTSRVAERKVFERLLGEGQSAGSAAAKVGIASSTGYKWARSIVQTVQPAQKPPQFARLVPKGQISPRIEIEVSGTILRVDAEIDVHVLARLVTALRRVS
jgi:transposase